MVEVVGNPKIKKIQLKDLSLSGPANLKGSFDLLDKSSWVCASTTYQGLWSEDSREALITLINSMERDLARFLFDDGKEEKEESNIPDEYKKIDRDVDGDLAEQF